MFLAAAPWALTATADAQVTLAHAAGYHAGGIPLGGGHPTACAYSFTVPEGPDRLLLVLGPHKYDPAIPKQVSTQRASLTSLTYAGRPLTYMPDEGNRPPGSAAGGVWYLLDPPAGTHNLDMRQFRYDNGGENRMAALAFTGVDQKDPFGERLTTVLAAKDKTVRYRIKGRKGGMVVDAIHLGFRKFKYFRITPAAGQTAVWEDCHDYRYEWMGSVKPGTDVVEMAWELGGSRRLSVRALSLNPSQPARAGKAVQPPKALPADAVRSDKPGLVARVYDLSAHPPAPSTGRRNWTRPAMGATIPPFDGKTLRATTVAETIDLHPHDYRDNPDRLPDEKGVLGTGIRTNFVLELTGRIHVPRSGAVMFKLLSVDQTKLLIDGRLVIDNRGNNYNTLKTGVVALEAGAHNLRLIHVEDAGRFGVSLGWRLPGGYEHGIPRGHKGPINIIPATAFTHAPEQRNPPDAPGNPGPARPAMPPHPRAGPLQ